MNYIVYKTTNLLNGRFYVGVHGTRNINNFDGYFGTGSIISKAVKLYGKKNFIRETLIDCGDDEDEAYSIESILVKTVKEDPRSYNLLPGGKRHNNSSRKSFGKSERDIMIKRLSNNSKLSRFYNDGFNEYKFMVNESEYNSINEKFEEFLLNNPNIFRGRLKRFYKKTNIKYRKYNDGVNEFNFKSLLGYDIDDEFDIFLLNNKQFNRGPKNRSSSKTNRDTLKGYRWYKDSNNNQYMFLNSSGNFQEFLSINPQFSAGRPRKTI
jgi:hypothetical protein